MLIPTTSTEKIIADDFANQWQFLLCTGASDGKHVVMQAPPHSSSMYFNYKRNCSMVFMTFVDADYNFDVVDDKAQKKHFNEGVFANSIFGKRLKNIMFDLLPPELLLRTNDRLPYAFLADNAFALHKYNMKPYSGLSRPEKILI